MDFSGGSAVKHSPANTGDMGLIPSPGGPGGFPGGSDSKEIACNTGDPGSIPGPGRSPGERNGNPHQYSCLENPMDRGAWQAIINGVAKSQKRFSD